MYVKIMLCWLMSISILAGQRQATLLATWNDETLSGLSAVGTDYNEVWGAAINDKEYAFIGSTKGVHVIEIGDDNVLEERFLLPGTHQGANVVHRDFKEFNHHLFVVGDQGDASLQIFDLQSLPDTVTEVYNSDTLVQRAHNIFIDTATAIAYVIGERSQEFKRAVILLDISNPSQPSYLSEIGINQSIFDGHDAYVRDNILYLNAGLEGLYIFDCSDPRNPTLQANLRIYPNQGYNHSGWLSEDGAYYFMADENQGLDCKVIDVSEKNEPRYIASFHPAQKDNFTIPHNLVVRDSFVFASYYFDGLQVFDIRNPAMPVLVEHYDTYEPPNSPTPKGAWGVYPFLPSGKILLSDISKGLFVFQYPAGLSTNTQNIQTLNTGLYPNPATEYITLTNIAVRDKVFQLFNLQGQLVGGGKVDATGQININLLPTGFYTCKVLTDSGIFVAPFIKN